MQLFIDIISKKSTNEKSKETCLLIMHFKIKRKQISADTSTLKGRQSLTKIDIKQDVARFSFF